MKKIKYGEEARNLLKKGVDLVYDVVASTMGPGGRTVVIDDEYNNPHITADGVTVAYAVETNEPFVCTGVALLKRAAMKANTLVGDGTSTTTVLTKAILDGGHRVANYPPVLVKQGMEIAQEEIIQHIDKLKKKAKKSDVKNIAYISSRGDESLSNLIQEAYDHVGKDGYIQVEPSGTSLNKLEKISGYQLDGGYEHPQYINNVQKNRVEYENPVIIVSNKELLDTNEVAQTLSQLLNNANYADKPIVLINTGCSEPVNRLLLSNFGAGKLQIVSVKPTDFGNNLTTILNDLAFVVEAVPALNENGLKLSEAKVGTCERVLITADKTVFIGIPKEAKDIEKFQKDLELSIDDSDNKDFTKKRVERLKGKLARLLIGAETEVELREKKDRADDCIGSVKAALKEGYLPGGGIALLYIQSLLNTNLSEAQQVGYDLVKYALDEPIKVILNNSLGEDHREVISEIVRKEFNYGYDAKNYCYCNLIETGIIDAAAVTKAAIKAAISVSKTIIETNAIIGVVGEQ